MPSDEKSKYEALPIPTYEEATSSRASTPNPDALRTTAERGHETERQGLLGPLSSGRTPIPTRRAGYRPPPSTGNESTGRHSASDDDDDFSFEVSGDEEEVRREMQELEIQDPPRENAWTKRISSISQSLSSLHLPFNIRLPRIPFRMPGLGGLGSLSLPKLDANAFVVLGRCVAILMVVAVVWLVFMSDIFTGAAQRMAVQMYNPEEVKNYVQMMVNADSIRGYLQHLTQFDHVAGTKGDYVLAEYVQGQFVAAGLEDVRMDEFGVYLNYPKEGGRKVELLDGEGKVKWTAKLEEEQAYDPPRPQLPVFHGLSKAGDVTGPLIYVNYGSQADFKRLQDSAIDTKGAIALARYYGTQTDRAAKVHAAQLAGFAGVLIYSDPAEDGFVQGPVWPEGRYMPSDGVQRGSVALTSWIVGDVLTPGFASKKGNERISKEDNPGLVKIPSIPISWRDAQPLLQALKGIGEAVPRDWQGGVPDVEWWSGNASSPKVHLKNEQDEVDEQPIWNVMAKITGLEQSDKSIIIGNHRDAWAFGAGDPGSGTAVFLEVVRIFGELRAKNWRPLRTIEFASWDAEEYNLIGSTEFVEDNIKHLRENAYAYLNVDVAVTGPDFYADGSPVFKRALMRCLSRTSDPFRNETLKKLWDDSRSSLGTLGAGSDYVAFQDIAGTSSIDFGFSGAPFPYHSVYDNFEWMTRFGDPDFSYHVTIAQIWVLLILELSDTRIVPFDMKAYSSSITSFVMDLERWVENKGNMNDEKRKSFSTEELRKAALQFNRDAKSFEEWETEWETTVYASGGFESTGLGAHRLSHNTRMANFETHLLDLRDGGGIPGREQYKHILFAPEAWSGYDGAVFPAIRDAVIANDWEQAQKAVDNAAGILSRASHKLVGNN